MGNPKHWSWQFFTSSEEVVNGKKKTVATCKFCPAHYNGNATDMAYHLTNQCKKIGEETRKTINKLAGIKQMTGEPPSKIAKRIESSTPSIVSFMDRVSDGEQGEIDILLTRAFATGNIAANFLDNPFFNQMMNKMRPSYKLPTRNYQYSKLLIPTEFERVKRNLEEATSKADFLALSSDGWSDVNRNRLINVIVHAQQPFLLTTIDATLDAHTGDYIRRILAEQIEKLGKSKIIAMVTDHAANMRLAWAYLQNDYPWILFEGCKAHMVDLAAKDLSKTQFIKECIEECVKIAKFFRKKIPSLVLKGIQETSRGRSKKFQLPEEGRWSTFSTLISDVALNENYLKSAVWNANITGMPALSVQVNDLQQLMCRNEYFWPRVNKIKLLLSPLAEAITAIEGSNVNQRKAYKSIKEAFDKAEKAIENFEDYLQPQMRQIINDRKKFGKTDVTYLMDLLEPSDRGQDLSEEQVQAAMEILSKKVLKNPIFTTKENQIMIELAQWRARTKKFAEGERKYAWDALNATPPVDGLSFWTGFFSDSPLSLVYRALQSVQITAASCERNWSIRTAIHTKVRNRLDVETASKLTFIKEN